MGTLYPTGVTFKYETVELGSLTHTPTHTHITCITDKLNPHRLASSNITLQGISSFVVLLKRPYF